MLRLERISVAYGKHEALQEVTLEALAGRTTAILGANGAGKTTLLKTVAGLVQPMPGGRIMFEGRPIEGRAPHEIVASGIALVPEGRRLFGEMTVEDNLKLGAYTEHAREHSVERLQRLIGLFPRLAERRNQLARTMSGGEQQMLAIARALMSEPKILLLDEPSLGLSPRLVKDLFAALRKITETGQAVLLVEQNAHQSLRLADYVYVLENGRIHSSGTPAEIQEDEVIQQAYLGREHKPAVKPLSAPAATPRAAGGLHEGGFVNPFARTVFRDQGPVGPDEERSMVSGLQSVYTGGGFFNPYARSVAPRTAPAAAPAAAASPEQAAPPAPKADAGAAGGGFYNPAARSIEPKR